MLHVPVISGTSYDTWKSSEPPYDMDDALAYGPVTECPCCHSPVPVMVADLTGGLCPECDAAFTALHADTYDTDPFAGFDPDDDTLPF